MNANDFSEALNLIDEKYIEEAEYYTHSKKKTFHKSAFLCAACLSVIFIVSAFYIHSSTKQINVSIFSSPVTNQEIEIQSLNRGISIASENKSLFLVLNLSTNNESKISVDSGEIGLYDTISGKTEKAGKEIVFDGEVDISWEISFADTDSVYTMELSKKLRKTNLNLKFNKEKESWVISAE